MIDCKEYPIHCRNRISKLSNCLCIDEDTAYAMMLITATLMDLDAGDPAVMDTILTGCKMEVDV